MPSSFRGLQQLPKELIADILGRLDDSSLRTFNCASRWSRFFATPLLWKEVTLTDCDSWSEAAEGCENSHDEGDGPIRPRHDEHDDIPMLRKLLLIANDPFLGSCVRTLNHICHLPRPNIFDELPRMSFSSSTLSCDARTAQLIKSAVKSMPSVTTLRIVFGHPNVNDALIRCFFDADRARTPQYLWLENCRVSAGCDPDLAHSGPDLPLKLDFSRLKSVRFRRLPLRPADVLDHKTFDPRGMVCNTRGYPGALEWHNGAGAFYNPSLSSTYLELGHSHALYKGLDRENEFSFLNEQIIDTFQFAVDRERDIYSNLAREAKLPLSVLALGTQYGFLDRGSLLDPDPVVSDMNLLTFKYQREQRPSSTVMFSMLRMASASLTHLCLDWVFTAPQNHFASRAHTLIYHHLFELRFPHLRSFQYRNAVLEQTAIPPNIYLLDYQDLPSSAKVGDEYVEWESMVTKTHRSLCGLEFMEAHPNLQCLAWPMEAFFASVTNEALAERVDAVVQNLSRTLIELRVDSLYSQHGEFKTEHTDHVLEVPCIQRRRFISDFAAKMTNLRTIKIEGGTPRDERREIVRALYRCPLKKVVMIGNCSPIGNTWGKGGQDLDPFLNINITRLEAEDKHATHTLGYKMPQPPAPSFHFSAQYGWPGEVTPPMLWTLASYHGSIIKELKFGGFKGAPILYTPTPITEPFLAPLRHFHNLEALTLSVYLKTDFEGEDRDADIIKYWLDMRNPQSTSLVRTTWFEPQGWEREIHTKYSPNAMAEWVSWYIGQFLSDTAKSRARGVFVRITLCIGESGLFEMDLRIGKSRGGDMCLEFKGPREEMEVERRREKLESRRWFK